MHWGHLNTSVFGGLCLWMTEPFIEVPFVTSPDVIILQDQISSYTGVKLWNFPNNETCCWYQIYKKHMQSCTYNKSQQWWGKTLHLFCIYWDVEAAWRPLYFWHQCCHCFMMRSRLIMVYLALYIVDWVCLSGWSYSVPKWQEYKLYPYGIAAPVKNNGRDPGTDWAS